tara:strand:- start:206 stop:892 length:687 start_codon:yes stop_codon:yes gene_type:complete
MKNKKVYRRFKRQKFAYLENRYSKSNCDQVIEFIDNYPEIESEMQYGGTEKRIWNAHKLGSDAIKEFVNYSNELIFSIFNIRTEPVNVLAYSNLPLNDSLNQQVDGRWHYDSFTKQFKVFLLLDEVTIENGCMQIIPRTGGFFKLRKAFQNGFIFHFRHIFSKLKRQAYSSISDKKIEQLINTGYKVRSLTGEAGQIIFVDTASLIHRASPCKSGKRYLLACYYKKVI